MLMSDISIPHNGLACYCPPSTHFKRKANTLVLIVCLDPLICFNNKSLESFPKSLPGYKVIANGLRSLMVITRPRILNYVLCILHHTETRRRPRRATVIPPSLLQVRKLLELIINLPKVTELMRSKTLAATWDIALPSPFLFCKA